LKSLGFLILRKHPDPKDHETCWLQVYTELREIARQVRQMVGRQSKILASHVDNVDDEEPTATESEELSDVEEQDGGTYRPSTGDLSDGESDADGEGGEEEGEEGEDDETVEVIDNTADGPASKRVSWTSPPSDEMGLPAIRGWLANAQFQSRARSTRKAIEYEEVAAGSRKVPKTIAVTSGETGRGGKTWMYTAL